MKTEKYYDSRCRWSGYTPYKPCSGGIIQEAGYDVKLSEVHGMAQRGGSVVTFVRYGEKVYEPIVEEGQADVLIAFEKLEAMRYAHFLKKDGVRRQ